MVIYSIDKSMDEVPEYTALYNSIVKILVMDSINDTR